MKTIPKITEKLVRDRVGERSFTLGERYYREGAIFNPRRQGRTLKARCEGSRAEAYRVEATFDTTPAGGSWRRLLSAGDAANARRDDVAGRPISVRPRASCRA